MARIPTLAAALLVSCCQAWNTFSPYQRQQAQLSHDEIHIRPAVEADLDDFTTVFIDAFSPGPVWRYVSPHHEQYKEYTWNCTREVVGQQFKHKPNNTFANVISVPDQHSTSDVQSKRKERVVAIANWKIIEPTAEDPTHGDIDLLDIGLGSTSCSDNIDMNMTRALDYNRQFRAADEHYVYEFPRKQMHLSLLATHPDWDGHGFGAAHCRWGMEMAKRMDVPVTLIATPAGWPLYDQLGFESIANISIKTLDEPEDLWYEYMRYDT